MLAGYTGEVVVRNAKPRYIAVEGPIGVGKSSLAEILGQELSSRVILDERPQENPFLGAFYKDRRRHAMSVQLFFLLQRYAQQGELAQGVSITFIARTRRAAAVTSCWIRSACCSSTTTPSGAGATTTAARRWT